VSVTDTFTWTPVPDALKYSVQLSVSENFTPLAFERKGIEGTQTEVTVPGSLTNYYWRVRAEDEVNLSAWTEPTQFQTTIYPPKAISPEDSLKNVQLKTRLEWETIDPISFFNVQVATDSSFAANTIVFSRDSMGQNETDLILDKYNTTYYWRLSSNYTECESGWSKFRYFTTLKGWPDLISPAADTSNIVPNSPLFWTEVEGAEFYDLELSETSDFEGLTVRKEYSLTSTNYQFPDMEENRVYYWRVRSKNQYGISDWSPTNSYTTGLFKPESVNLINPSNGAVNTDTIVEFRWRMMENADTYDFQLSANIDFNTLVDSSYATSDSLFLVSGLENDTRYYWRVRSENKTGVSEWSSTFRFNVIEAAPNGLPNLTFPEDQAINQDLTSIRFRWEAVENADRYLFQLASADTFEESMLVSDKPNISSTSTSVFGFDQNTTYYWRVKAVNTGGQTDWSAIYSFTTLDASSVIEDISSDLKITPNPVTDILTVNLESALPGELSLSIIDVNGRRMNIGKFQGTQNSLTIDLSRFGLTNGVYQLIINSDNYFGTISFVKSSK
jgi:hypothetical protein